MLKLIYDSFYGLTLNLWISQICGLIGLIVIGVALLFDKKKFIGIATVSFVFFVLEQLFAQLYSNLIVSFVSLIRNLIMFILLTKYNKELSKYGLLIVIIIMWSGEIIYMGITKTFNVWDNYLPPLIVTMSTCTQNSKNNYVVKIGATIHETGFLVYYLIYMLPLSIFRQALLVLSGIIGLIILIAKNNKQTKHESLID